MHVVNAATGLSLTGNDVRNHVDSSSQRRYRTSVQPEKDASHVADNPCAHVTMVMHASVTTTD